MTIAVKYIIFVFSGFVCISWDSILISQLQL